MARDFASQYLRFDARSMGLFRVGMGATLIFDLFHRWDWIRAFYSNEGVLPNHHHLFQLKEGAKVWSPYHSFSSVEENFVAFLLTLFFYLCFTVGWKTRAFHVVSLVCAVGLSARNTLAEGPGDSVAIALLAVTAFLPLGAGISIDSLRRSMSSFDEKTAADLNDRDRPAVVWPRQSLAALATLMVLGLILVGASSQQTGASWQDGTALHYALHVDRWTSGIGVALRNKSGLLSIWTTLLRWAPMVVVPLALVPGVRKITGPLATLALMFVGLSYGVLFTFGMYGWALAAAAMLLIPTETWEGLKANHAITFLYDDDCGICLLGARLFKRFDLRKNITFQANSDEAAFPKTVTAKLVDKTMIVVTPSGAIKKDIAAAGELVSALPLLGWVRYAVMIPGLHQLLQRLYFRVADNRREISVAMGLGACGVPVAAEADDSGDDTQESPAAKTWSAVATLVASSGALIALVSIWAQTEAHNTMPLSVGLGHRTALAAPAEWARVRAPWGVLAPEPPRDNEGLVVVATTRGEYVVDVLTGYPPDENLDNPRRRRQGKLWSTYTANIADEAFEPYRKEFRRYLTKGGYAIDTKVPNNYIRTLVVYWVKKPIPAPGAAADAGEPTRVELFNRRGGASRKRPRLPRVTPEKK